MKVASNKVSDIRHFIRKHLKGLSPVEEIDSFFFILLEEYCGLSKTELLSGKRDTINESELLLVYDAIKELEEYKPIQYVTGKAFFCGLRLNVNPAVLIPRPETEELVSIIIEENKNKGALKILDIGTGSGCIAIALKNHLPASEVTAIDISVKALDTAMHNAMQYGVDIKFLCTDILDENQWHSLSEFDIIVSNPPYVSESEKKQMHPNVLDFEPSTALFVSDDNPLLYYKAIFQLACRQKNEVIIYAEINECKAAEISALAVHYGISETGVIKDINGKDRFFRGRRIL